MSIFRGSFVALITPFDFKGRVDLKRLEQLIEWHIASGTDGIVCCGTTGEAPSLTERDRKIIIEVCVKTARKRIPIIAGTGVSGTSDSVKLTERAQKLGADGCLVPTPYYNKPSQKGCILHFQEVAKVGLPVIVYNNPGRSVVALTAETTLEIGRISGIVAIKESIHDLEVIRKVRSIPIFCGEDDFTLEMIQEGAIGVISVIGNLIPHGWKQMVQFALEGKWDHAKILARKFMPLCKSLFYETNPQCVKYALFWLGRSQSTLRLPLIEPNEATQRELKKALLGIALPQFQKIKSRQVG